MSTRATFAGKLRLLNNMAKQVRPLRDLLRSGASKQSRDLTCWSANGDLRPSSRGRLCSSTPLTRPCSSSCYSPNFLPKTDTLAGSLLNQRLSFLASLSRPIWSGHQLGQVKHPKKLTMPNNWEVTAEPHVSSVHLGVSNTKKKISNHFAILDQYY